MNFNLISKEYIESSSIDVMKFAVVGDSKPDYDTYYDMLYLLPKDVKFVAHVGDFTDWSWPWEYGNYTHKITGYMNKIKSFKPMFHCIGNHDNRLFGNRLFNEYFGPWNFSVNYGKWSFIFVRNVYVTKYGLTSDTMGWLEDTLSECNEYVSIFMHVPPAVPFDSLVPSKKLLHDDRYNDILSSCNNKIKLAFYGHAHMYVASMHEGIMHTITGGGAPNLHECPNEPPIRRYGNHITIVTVDQNGNYKTELMTEHGIIVNVYDHGRL